MTDNAIATLLYDYYSPKPTAGKPGDMAINVSSPASASSSSSLMSSPRHEDGSSLHQRHNSGGRSSSPIMVSHTGAEIDTQAHTDNLLLSLAQTSSLDLQMRKRKKPEPVYVEAAAPVVKPLRFIEERLPQSRSRLGSPSRRSPTEGVFSQRAGGPPYSTLATRSPRAISPDMSRTYYSNSQYVQHGDYPSRPYNVAPSSSAYPVQPEQYPQQQRSTPPYTSSPYSTPDPASPNSGLHSPPSSPSTSLSATARQVHNQYVQQTKRQQRSAPQHHVSLSYSAPLSRSPADQSYNLSQRSSLEHTNNLSLALHCLEAFRKASVFFPLPTATMTTEAVYNVINILNNGGAQSRSMSSSSYFCTLLGLALGASLRGLKDFAAVLCNEARSQLGELFDITSPEVAWGMCALSAFYCHFTAQAERYSYFNVLASQMCRRLSIDTTEIQRWCLRNQFFAIMHQPKDLDNLEELNAVEEEIRALHNNSLQPQAPDAMWKETTRTIIEITKLLTVLKACRQNGQPDPKESQRLKSATRVLRHLMRGFESPDVAMPLVATIASQLVVGSLATECLSMRNKNKTTLKWAENVVNLLRSNRPILRYVVPQGFSFLATILDHFFSLGHFDLVSDMLECMGEWAPIYPCVAEMINNYKITLRNAGSTVASPTYAAPQASFGPQLYQPSLHHKTRPARQIVPQYQVEEEENQDPQPQSQRQFAQRQSSQQRSLQPAAEEQVGQERDAKRLKMTTAEGSNAPSEQAAVGPQPAAFTVSGNTEQMVSGALSSVATASVGAGLSSTSSTQPSAAIAMNFPSPWFEAELASGSSSESWMDVASNSSNTLGLAAAVASATNAGIAGSGMMLMSGATDSLWHAATMADFSSSLMHISSYSSDVADAVDDGCDDMFLSSGSSTLSLGVIDYEAEIKRNGAGGAGAPTSGGGGGFNGGVLPFLECNFLVGVFD